MLAGGKAIGHASDVVGNRPRAVASLAVLGGHFMGAIEVDLKQLAHDAARPVGGRHHLRVAVQVVKQKLLQDQRALAHGRAKAHHRGRQAHAICAALGYRLHGGTGVRHHVIHLIAEHAPDRFIKQTPGR